MKNTLQALYEGLYTGVSYLVLFLSTSDLKETTNLMHVLVLLIFAFGACYGTLKLSKRRKKR